MVDSASAGVCTLSGSTSGSTVTYTAAGSCVIDASQPGNGTYAAAQAKQTITVNGKPPAVTGVSPSFGACQGGYTVKITGTDLAGATSVSSGGVSAKFTVDSSTQITATSPAVPNNTGYVDITVTTSSGTSAMTEQDQFEYTCGT
jgi:hypothetical protein